MLIEKAKCKTVNATYEVYDDYAKPYSPEEKAKIEKKCSEIVMRHYAKEIAKEQDTAWGLYKRTSY